MLVEVFPQLYERIQGANAAGGVTLWHLFRSCDPEGSGRVRTTLAALTKIFRVSESSIRRWLKAGATARLFDFRYIGRKRVWIRYKSWRKLFKEVNLPHPFVGHVPASVLGHKKVTATLLLQLCLQESSFRKAYREKGFGCRYDDLLLKSRRSRNSAIASDIQVTVKESRYQWVTPEVIEIPGIKCLTTKQFRRYTKGGTTSAILYETDRHLCVQAGELTYGASLDLAAKIMGCSKRTIQRRQQHIAAHKVGFKKKRLCRGAMDVDYWIKDQFGSYGRAFRHFEETRRRKKIGKPFAEFILSYLNDDPHFARYSLPIYQSYLDRYSKYLEEVNYKPSRMVLKHPLLQKFKLIPITVNYISHRRTLMGNWKTSKTSKRKVLFIENLTNIYASRHLKVGHHRRYYIEGLKSSHFYHGGQTIPQCYNDSLAQSILLSTEIKKLAE